MTCFVFDPKLALWYLCSDLRWVIRGTECLLDGRDAANDVIF